MKKFKKITILLLVSLLIFSSFTYTYADAGEDVGRISTIGSAIVSAIIWCGYAVSVLMVIFIGIKYILGSAEAKANMKSAVVGYLIGAALVFSTTTIANIVINLIPDAGSDPVGMATQIIDSVSNQ